MIEIPEGEHLSTEPRIAPVILGLGSNLGDRVRNIEQALGRLIMHVRLERISEIYETEPVELRDQPWFLNLVCTGTTRLAPWDLLEFIHEIEKGLGRERDEERYGPRPIDIDILAYDDRTMEEPDLTIPHPRMTERAFVLVPLAEIAPDWCHPVTGEAARGMAARVDTGTVRPHSIRPRPASSLL